MRAGIVLVMLLRSNRALDDDNPVPILLFAAIAPVMLTGQFGVPTILGFACFGSGLCLAAANSARTPATPQPFSISPGSVTDPTRAVRGRSIYAEKLHGR